MPQLDRTAFKRQTAEEADHQLDYWLERSLLERLRAAMWMNASAWGFSLDNPPSINKQFFKATKRMSSEIFFQDFLEFLRALNEHEVAYLLVGGYAVILHGYPRTTGDLDVWVQPTEENYRKLTAAFQDFGMPVFDMTPENFLDTSGFDVFTFGTPPISIDIMTQVKGLEFEEVFPKAGTVTVDGDLSVRLISLEDLLKAKRASGRSKDFNDIRHLTKNN